MLCSIKGIGSTPPAVLRLPSAVSSHKKQRLSKNLIPCNFKSLILIPRLKKKVQVSGVRMDALPVWPAERPRVSSVH